MILERDERFSIDEHGNVTYGELATLLALLAENAAAQVGVIHRGRVEHYFFPVPQFVVDDGHIHAPITRTVPDIARSGNRVTWDVFKEKDVFVYCTDGYVYSNLGIRAQRARMDWYVFSSRQRIVKPLSL